MQSNPNRIQHQACSSCKHQRKKCSEDCVLAPYFPANRSKEFQAVHKIFGVSNVQKIVRTVKEEDRKRVADSLIWEAFCRQKDPVLGPYGEYRRIYEELKLYKTQTQLGQMVGQGTLLYKTSAGPPPMIGWNKGIRNGGGFVNNNCENEIDLSKYCYNPQQQQHLNGYNQQCYLNPGKF